MRTQKQNTKKNNRKKAAAFVTAGVLGLATAGGAYAYWSSQGNGTGAASTGSSTTYTVTTDAATGGPLTPGGPKQTVAFHVVNPGTGTQNISSVVISVDPTWSSQSNVAKPACTATDFALTAQTDITGQIDAGAKKDGSIDIQLVNAATNQDNCQGVTVPLKVAVS